MKINQVYSLVNDVFGEAVGESVILAEDLSNIADFGRVLESNDTFGDNFNIYTKAMIDKIGYSMVTGLLDFKSTAPDIMGTDAEFGSVLEKYRVFPKGLTAVENKSFNTSVGGGSSHAEMYGYYPAKTTARYYNSVSTFQTETVTITELQLKSAFRSRGDMLRFISAIENAMRVTMLIDRDELQRRLVNALIADRIKNGLAVINLLDLFHDTGGSSSVTASNWDNGDENSRNFLAFVSKTLIMYRDFIGSAGVLYNSEGYINQTYGDNLRFYMLTDLSASLRSYLYSNTFNKDEIMVNGYGTVPYWQGRGTADSFTDRSSIDVKLESDGDEIKKSGIVAVMFDRRAAMVNAQNPRAIVIPNLADEWTNHSLKWDAGYFVDPSENVIVFTIEDTN